MKIKNFGFVISLLKKSVEINDKKLKKLVLPDKEELGARRASTNSARAVKKPEGKKRQQFSTN